MKCHIHPETEATGVCVACGNAVCAECGVPVQGILHCRTCIEMGRIRRENYRGAYPGQEIPRLKGKTSKTLFTAGMFGSLIAAVASVAYSLFGFGYYGYWLQLPFIFAFLALGVSVSLMGFGFYGLGRTYGNGIGTAAWALAQVACIGYILFAVSFALTREYDPYGFYFPYSFLIYGIWVFEAAASILGGIAFIFSRRLHGNEDLALTAGIALMVAGVLLWIPILGMFMGVAAIITAVAFSKARLVGTQD